MDISIDICTQDILVTTNILLLSCANVSKIRTTQLRPTLGQVAPCLSKPYQTEPSGQFGRRQCQLSRCSTGPSRVSKEEVYRQEVFKTLPSLSPQNTSVMPSRWPVVTGVSSSLLGFLPRASHHPPVRCKCRHVCPGHGPIPLSKQVQRINYKKNQYWDKMSSGEQTCQHPQGMVPVPPVH